MAKKKKTDRNTKWTFIMYEPEDTSEWTHQADIDRLKELKVPFLISPRHDKDKDENGDLKKPHWHVVLYFESLKSQSQIIGYIEDVGVNGARPEGVLAPKMMIRYLIHMDEEEDKHKYNKDDIYCHGNLELTVSDAMQNKVDDKKLVLECFQFISENNITEYCDIVDHVLNYQIEWFNIVIQTHSYPINSYINSSRNKQK